MSDRAVPAPAEAPVAPLPLWPLTVMFGLVPIWWALGGFYLAWPVFGLVLLALLVTRGRIALPYASTVWLVFLVLVLLSVTRLDRATAYLTFGLRFGFLLTALVVCVYVYNLAREGLTWHRLLRPLGLYWLGVVALGWLGVLMPSFALTTPVEMLLPGNVATERYIQALTHVRANEFNPLSASPIYRTAAPYPYTNNWGTAYALLVPCVVGYLTSVRGGAFRVVLMVSLPLSMVPAFMTLNRGMFLGLGIGLTYLGVRALLRGNAKLIASIGVLVLLVWVVSLVVPVQEMIDNRVSSTDTNVDRMDLYVRTWEAVERSPLLGYGAPNSVDTTKAGEPLGTQGMVWQVLYSHGIPALLVFLSWLVLMIRRLALAVSPAGQWLGVLPVIALVVIPVYAYIDPNMSVLFYAVGAALAAVAGPVNREPTLPAGAVRRTPLADRPRWDPPAVGPPPAPLPAGTGDVARGVAPPAGAGSAPPRGIAAPACGPASPPRGIASPVPGPAAPPRGIAAPVPGPASPARGIAAPVPGPASPARGVASPARGPASPAAGAGPGPVPPARGMVPPPAGGGTGPVGGATGAAGPVRGVVSPVEPVGPTPVARTTATPTPPSEAPTPEPEPQP